MPFECCDGCIDQALASLQEIRSLLVDQQVELADLTDGPLYLLLDVMREGIRQFLTFEQQLGARGSSERPPGLRRRHEDQALYFAGLEALRAHLRRSLIQVAAIADVEIPGFAATCATTPAGRSKPTRGRRCPSEGNSAGANARSMLRGTTSPSQHWWEGERSGGWRYSGGQPTSLYRSSSENSARTFLVEPS